MRPILLRYTGALAIRNIFDLQSLPLWSISAIIGTFGACYALFGGLKVVANVGFGVGGRAVPLRIFSGMMKVYFGIPY